MTLLIHPIRFGTAKLAKQNDETFLANSKDKPVDPLLELTGETPAESKNLSPADKFYTLYELYTKPGKNGEKGEKLPHPFLQVKTKKSDSAAVLGVVFKDPKDGEYKLYTQDEFRPSLGRNSLSVSGGNIEPEENPLTASIRELDEETNSRFKRTGPLYMLKTPIAELPALTPARLYIGVTLGEPKSKMGPDKRDEAEKSLLEIKQKPEGIPITTLLHPKKLREFIVKEQSKIINTNGEKGSMIAPNLLFIAALMGDAIKQLIKLDQSKTKAI